MSLQRMNVNEIRYTQDSISGTFSDGAPIQDTIFLLQTKQINPGNIPPIKVVFYEGHYRTMDNRRLFCFKSANIKKVRFDILIIYFLIYTDICFLIYSLLFFDIYRFLFMKGVHPQNSMKETHQITMGHQLR
jgi:hypothetical protein